MSSADSSPLAFWLDVPWLALSPLLPGPANNSCWSVYALRRSGHHAILNWILAHLPGRHCLLNDCTPGSNPLATCSRGNSVVKGWAGQHGRLLWRLERRGWRAHKGHCFHNYEDGDFTLHPPHSAHEEQWLGRSSRRGCILILRDPFNLFASQLRWARGAVLPPSAEQLQRLPLLWMLYAREALGITHHLGDAVVIHFNHWFTRRVYRDQIANQLGFHNQDLALDTVARFGPSTWGDSFDGLTYDGQARRMPVLDRWRDYVQDPDLRAMLADSELLNLARTLYPDATALWEATLP